MKKTIKSRCELKTRVYLVLHSFVSLKIFFVEKMNQFFFESYINVNRKERK